MTPHPVRPGRDAAGLEGLFQRPGATGLDRRRAGQQPRPARGGPAHRGSARAVRRAARRPAAVRGRHGRLQPQPRVRSRPVTRCDQPAVPRRRRHHRLRAGLLRPDQEPHRRGAGALPGQRRGAPRRRAVAGGRNRHGLFQRAFAGRAAAADPQHAGIARDHTDADPAPLRRRPGNRHGPAHRADAGGIVARHAGRTQPRAQPGRACAGPAGG